MIKMDWEILPAPAPWKSISKFEYERRWGFAYFLWMPCVVMFAFWIWTGFETGKFFSLGMNVILLIGLGSLIIGSVAQLRLYQKSTDGIDSWMIMPPRSSDLCAAMETAFDKILKAEEIQYTLGKLKTENINMVTNKQYGRNYIIHLDSNGYFYQQGSKNQSDSGSLVLDFAYRPGSKYTSAYLTIELRGITQTNYNSAVVFQKKVVETLEGLDYQSYSDQLWK